jgi:hypothetical protein
MDVRDHPIATTQRESDGPDQWRELMAQHWPPSCFPATPNDLLSLCLRRHAPSSLWWLVSQLPPDRRLASLEDVITELSRRKAH